MDNSKEEEAEHEIYVIGKRAFDVAASVVAIGLSAIPVALLGVIVSAQSAGAPFYVQKRVGKDGKPIEVIKLRSMYADADDVKKYLNDEQLEQWKTERKVDNDPRITPIGRFIRATSLDEIPQFLNVLAGDLSIVGPRPITSDELENSFTDEERARITSVKPGITGLWQTGERNKATFASGRRQEIELSYVRRMSPALDLKICLMTVKTMLSDKTGR